MRTILPRLEAQEAPSAKDTVASIIDAYLSSRQFLDLADKTRTDYAKLKHAALPVIRIAMLLARLTAVRESDLLALTWHQIRDGEIHIQPGKTQNTRRMKQRIGITKAVKVVLEAARTSRSNLRSTTAIHTGHSQPYTQSGFQSMWQRVVKASGVHDVHFHGLKARAVTDAER